MTTGPKKTIRRLIIFFGISTKRVIVYRLNGFHDVLTSLKSKHIRFYTRLFLFKRRIETRLRDIPGQSTIAYVFGVSALFQIVKQV